ncbi:MAG: hypothetical protein K0Q52_383 [Microbacterium sp.]|nr:hypothetical protein [Microbacterium sp.]
MNVFVGSLDASIAESVLVVSFAESNENDSPSEGTSTVPLDRAAGRVDRAVESDESGVDQFACHGSAFV